jgi:hypothetical protein
MILQSLGGNFFQENTVWKRALVTGLGLLLMSTSAYAAFPRADGSRHDRVIYESRPDYRLDVRYPILNSATLNVVITDYVDSQISAFRNVLVGDFKHSYKM